MELPGSFLKNLNTALRVKNFFSFEEVGFANVYLHEKLPVTFGEIFRIS
jgi:hypothetical protein